MAIRAYYVEDAALAQLEVALRLYFSGDERDLLSVITLAGAAEELFGQLLAAKGIENSIESIKKAIVAISAILSLDGDPVTLKEAANRANRAKIRLKHWNAQTDNALIELDADFSQGPGAVYEKAVRERTARGRVRGGSRSRGTPDKNGVEGVSESPARLYSVSQALCQGHNIIAACRMGPGIRAKSSSPSRASASPASAGCCSGCGG
jgi:hypothetical protein